MKTLIVDDDIVTCEHASLIMSDLGLQAEDVTSGALAVLEIEKGIREMNPYDIVLVDPENAGYGRNSDNESYKTAGWS